MKNISKSLLLLAVVTLSGSAFGQEPEKKVAKSTTAKPVVKPMPAPASKPVAKPFPATPAPAAPTTPAAPSSRKTTPVQKQPAKVAKPVKAN